MRSTVHSPARARSAGLQSSIAQVMQAASVMISCMNERHARGELRAQAHRLRFSHPETATQMRKAADSVWE